MEDTGALQFKASDFESYSWSFEVTNLTSKRPVQPAVLIQVLEMGDRGLTLVFPSKSCAVGHQLEVKANVSLPSTPENIALGPVHLQCTAKVDRIEHLDDIEDLVEITFMQIDAAAWNKIKGVVVNRQAAIFDFFKAVKGEE